MSAIEQSQNNREPRDSSNGQGAAANVPGSGLGKPSTGIRQGGPSDAAERWSLADSRRRCREIAKAHSENFLVASVLLPRRLRQPFYDIYAFCRLADDLADDSPTPQVGLQRLQDFGQRLRQVFAGEPPAGIFIALADTIQRFGLPREPFEALLDAFRQDQRRVRYETAEQLADYCRRSANPVGHLVLQLAGCFDASNESLSDRICTGLQLANFWQDVARDFEIGRIYIPSESMTRYGVTELMFSQRPTAPSLRRLLQDECDRTESLLREGLPLADRVPPWLAADVKLFAHGGLSTLDAIRRIDFDVLAQRPTVSRWRQMGLLSRVLLRRL